ncbi:MAG: hypothetical protein E6J72_14015 [Deltaproteobacteria bacterium]|nr:MAG: hypothetical protein E6J72_14015 [Deltaproteobacteria bacterium]
MRKTWIAAMAGALALGSTFMVSIATAEMNERSVTTEKTTTYSGTVSEIDPSSSTITIRSETAPAPTKYVFTKETVFADPQGHVVSYDAIRNTPVTVYYTREGDRMIVSKVVTTKPVVTEHRESTTTERHEIQ